MDGACGGACTLGFMLWITAHPIETVVFVTITFWLRYGVITTEMSCHISMSYLLTPTDVTPEAFQPIFSTHFARDENTKRYIAAKVTVVLQL